jgi:hypothetical protein
VRVAQPLAAQPQLLLTCCNMPVTSAVPQSVSFLASGYAAAYHVGLVRGLLVLLALFPCTRPVRLLTVYVCMCV